MAEENSATVPRPTIWRMALVVAVFVGIGGGVMALLGQAPVWPVFVALGVVTAMGTRRRWKESQGAH